MPAPDRSEPWQIQETRRMVDGIASDSPYARQGRRVLGYTVLAVVMIIVLGALIAVALD